MLATGAQRYKQVQQQTLTQGELLLALYDGLFRFMNQAKLCFQNSQMGRGRELVSKAHAIISELYCALDFKVNPELCGNLAGLYDFSLSRLLEANRAGDADAIDEVIRVLTPLREAWQEAVPQAQKENASSKQR